MSAAHMPAGPMARDGLALLRVAVIVPWLAITLMLGAAVPAAAAIPPVPGPCVDGWREIPIPDASFLSTPFEVLTRNGKEAWILGGANKGVLALRYNGTAWKRTAGTSKGHRGLVGGTVIGDRKVLGVGYYRPMWGAA